MPPVAYRATRVRPFASRTGVNFAQACFTRQYAQSVASDFGSRLPLQMSEAMPATRCNSWERLSALGAYGLNLS